MRDRGSFNLVCKKKNQQMKQPIKNKAMTNVLEGVVWRYNDHQKDQNEKKKGAIIEKTFKWSSKMCMSFKEELSK